MGRLTRYIGGQTVTDSTGTGERQLEMVSDLPVTPLSGVIYLTPSEVANSSEITAFELQSAASITRAAQSFTVRVSGDEGAEFSITGTDGASNVGNMVIPSVGFIDVSVSVTENGQDDDERTPTATLVVNPSSDPETILADGFTDVTESVTQAAGLISRTCSFTSNGNLRTFTWSDGGTAGVTWTVNARPQDVDAGGDTVARLHIPAQGGVASFDATSPSSTSQTQSVSAGGYTGGTISNISPTFLFVGNTGTLTASVPASATHAACSATSAYSS